MTLQRMFGQGKRLRYLCEDQTQVGLKSETARVITSRGVKPIAAVQWKRDNYWIYGVVEPLTGWHFTQEYQRLDSEQFQAFLDALSVQLGEDIALIQLDQASSHQALSLHWHENLMPILQPAHSPQLNPFERLWQFLKAQLKGENFASLDALKARMQQLLEQVTPEQVASLTSYDFILEALFYAAI